MDTMFIIFAIVAPIVVAFVALGSAPIPRLLTITLGTLMTAMIYLPAQMVASMMPTSESTFSIETLLHPYLLLLVIVLTASTLLTLVGGRFMKPVEEPTVSGMKTERQIAEMFRRHPHAEKITELDGNMYLNPNRPNKPEQIVYRRRWWSNRL